MWPNPQFPVDLVTFTEEILNGKLHFLCSVSAHNFLKLSLLRGYFTVHSFDVICLPKTYPDLSVLHDDE